MTMPFNIVLGNPVAGLSVSSNMAVISAPLAIAKNFGLKRPAVLATEKTARADNGAEGVALSRLRKSIQRRFDAKRRHRVVRYASYLMDVRAGNRPGGTPPITLFCDRELVESNGVLHVPFGAKIVVIDGETQTEARFVNADRHPETQADPVAFVVWHGVSPEHASQLMHDFNTFANPVPEREVAAVNAAGGMTQSVMSGIASSGVDPQTINRYSNSLRKKSLVTSFDRLLSAVAGFVDPARAKGHGGIGAIIRDSNTADANFNREGAAAAVAHLLTLATRSPRIARAPEPVWAAWGARSRSRAVTEAECISAIDAFEKAGRGAKTAAAFNAI